MNHDLHGCREWRSCPAVNAPCNTGIRNIHVGQNIGRRLYIRSDFSRRGVIHHARSLRQVLLETDVPIFSVVLTPQHLHEHADHRDYFLKRFVTKGAEAARLAIAHYKALRNGP